MSVVVSPIKFQSRNAAMPASIQWILPEAYFHSVDNYDDSKNDFDYQSIAEDFFTDPTKFDDWLRFNDWKIWPDNRGVMDTPIDWFKPSIVFALTNSGWLAESDSSKSGVFWWLLIAFSGIAIAGKS